MNAQNAYTKQAEEYKKNQIETAPPEKILIMLYDGAIRFLLLAKKAMQEQNLEKANANLIKAQHIIREFMDSLDMEVGGQMAVNLYNLYEYLHYRLVEANIKKEVVMIDEVLDHLRSLKATWEEAILITARSSAQEKALTAHDPDTPLRA
jgi:flagellar protein FliS